MVIRIVAWWVASATVIGAAIAAAPYYFADPAHPVHQWIRELAALWTLCLAAWTLIAATKGCRRRLPLKAREDLRRRAALADTLNTDLDTIAEDEHSQDQHFTDLEVEVEAEGRYYATARDRRRQRPSIGLRREPSLVRALETTAEEHLVLLGEPGSGKSVALRHLGHVMAERAMKERDPRAPLPLYVNLRDLRVPPGGEPSADVIEEFVLTHIRGDDTSTERVLREFWDDYCDRGLWYFLLDSFDEIPAVLNARAGDRAVERYARAIQCFLTGRGRRRGIVASRVFKGPDPLPWPRLTIQPLSQRKQDELIDNTDLSAEDSRAVKMHLADGATRVVDNPMLLTLLCAYVGEYHHAPTSDYDLLDGHISQLIESGARNGAREYRVEPQELKWFAERLSVLVVEDGSLGLAPTQEEITSALSGDGVADERVERYLGALVQAKLLRCDVPLARPGQQHFEFTLRRYQETLFIRHLIAHRAYTDAGELLTDERWREYAVALLQTQPMEELAPILAAAQTLLGSYGEAWKGTDVLPECGTGLHYWEWTDARPAHLLELLNQGLVRRRPDVPDEFHGAVKGFLWPRWREGDEYDRARVLELAALLPGPEFLECFHYGSESLHTDLRSCAFALAAHMPGMDMDTIGWVCWQVSERVVRASTRADDRRCDALAGRLVCANIASAVVRRSRSLRDLHRLVVAPVWVALLTVPLSLLWFVDRDTRRTTGWWGAVWDAAGDFCMGVPLLGTYAYALLWAAVSVLRPVATPAGPADAICTLALAAISVAAAAKIVHAVFSRGVPLGAGCTGAWLRAAVFPGKLTEEVMFAIGPFYALGVALCFPVMAIAACLDRLLGPAVQRARERRSSVRARTDQPQPSGLSVVLGMRHLGVMWPTGGLSSLGSSDSALGPTTELKRLTLAELRSLSSLLHSVASRPVQSRAGPGEAAQSGTGQLDPSDAPYVQPTLLKLITSRMCEPAAESVGTQKPG